MNVDESISHQLRDILHTTCVFSSSSHARP